METKTSYLRNSPGTHFLANRPKEMDLEQENKQLIKENNYLHTIVDRLIKAFVDSQPEPETNRVFEFFTAKSEEFARGPEVYYHKFEFLDKLFNCYDKKIAILEQSNKESLDKLQVLEKTFDDVVNFYKNELQEKENRILQLFTEKFENDDPQMNAEFTFQNQLLRNEQQEFLKALQEELALHEQLSKDLSSKLSFSQTELREAQEKLADQQQNFEKVQAELTKKHKDLQENDAKLAIFQIKLSKLQQALAEKENHLQETEASFHSKHKEFVLNSKKMELQSQELASLHENYQEELNKLKEELSETRTKEREVSQNLQFSQRKCKETEEKLATASKEARELAESLHNSQEKAEKLQRELAEARKIEENLKKKEKSSEETLYNLSTKNDELSLTITKLEKSVEKSRNSQEIEEAKRVQEFEAKLRHSEERFREEIEKKDEELMKLQGELYSLKVLAERNGKENVQLKGNLKDFIGLKDESQRVVAEKNKVIKELRTKLSVLDEELNRKVISVTFEKNSLESTVENFKEELEKGNEKLKSLGSTINILNNEKAELSKHIENLKKDKQELVEKLESLRRRLQEKYEELLEEN